MYHIYIYMFRMFFGSGKSIRRESAFSFMLSRKGRLALAKCHTSLEISGSELHPTKKSSRGIPCPGFYMCRQFPNRFAKKTPDLALAKKTPDLALAIDRLLSHKHNHLYQILIF